MYGYDHKELTLTSSTATTITVELDFLADNTWSTYQTFNLTAGQTLTHTFPAGFHAHWVRVKSSASTTASAQFVFGPATVRDRFLDWSRDQGLPTGQGREGVMATGPGTDGLSPLIEFLTDGHPENFDANPLEITGKTATIVLRDLLPEDRIAHDIECSTNLETWDAPGATIAPSPDQSGVAPGFTRHQISPPAEADRFFVRLKAALDSSDSND